jgi:predicted alpha/beta-fold hydrolase
MKASDIGITTAWKILITPNRTDYDLDCLGPKVMSFQKYDSLREDFSFVNAKGNTIQASLFVPIHQQTGIDFDKQPLLNCPCLIYCHSQQGCRIEGLFLQEFCIENGIGLCVFDFSGCGKSEGEFVTLGWNETNDLSQLIDIITRTYSATRISLWGRSMGAVTNIMFAERNSFFVSAMVRSLDIGFSI